MKYMQMFESFVNEKQTEKYNNMWLEKLEKDLLQNKYNLNKIGLYTGLLKEGIENLLDTLKDIEIAIKQLRK